MNPFRNVSKDSFSSQFQSTRPVDIYDPDDGRSDIKARADHKHKLDVNSIPRTIFFQTDVLDNGTSLSSALYGGNTNIGKAPCNGRMFVTAVGQVGFTAAINQAAHRISDEAGVNITRHGGAQVVIDNNPAAMWQSMTMYGWKDYALGDTMGYQLAYNVNTSNLYTRFSVRIDFIPTVYLGL